MLIGVSHTHTHALPHTYCDTHTQACPRTPTHCDTHKHVHATLHTHTGRYSHTKTYTCMNNHIQEQRGAHPCRMSSGIFSIKTDPPKGICGGEAGIICCLIQRYHRGLAVHVCGGFIHSVNIQWSMQNNTPITRMHTKQYTYYNSLASMQIATNMWT